MFVPCHPRSLRGDGTGSDKATNTMIRLEHITKTYASGPHPVTALRDVSLRVAPREIFGVIGSSGAGKSTLIRCVNLLERPDTGQVWVGDTELTRLKRDNLRAARRRIGMIFQSFNLLSSRTVYDNIALPLELNGLSREAIRQAVHPLLELTGLTERMHHYPAQLSGGQKQRVAIARALAGNPDVLLSDEATSALDPASTQSILELLKNIRETLGLTILLITHDMQVIKSACDRVAILQSGTLQEQNEVGEFFAHPATEIARNFVTSSLPQALPSPLARCLVQEAKPQHHPVLRLWFFGGAATQPVMTQLIQQFGLRVNILQASVEYVREHAMGVMTLAVEGEPAQREAAVAHLRGNGITVEALGYVPDNIVSFI